MTRGNICDSFTLCPAILAANSAMKSTNVDGLQIREDRFDSDTRLQLINDLAAGFRYHDFLATFMATFVFCACSVRAR